MITLEINGKQVTADSGQNILAAANDAGIEIPHFCYHPGLKIAGNCRMCLVEIENIPKLQIACATPVKEGMKVKTESPAVVAARQGVLEFLLINHPIDCPVCDQAGECSLQNYYQKYGLYKSRFDEHKVNKDKVIDLGSGVMLDMERCVLCGRCVRFMRDVAKDEQLGIVNRGDHSQIQTLNGRKLDSLYAGNVYDICPVGALTGKDFRFKCRVWYLKSTQSICPGCSTGCNILLDHYKNRVHRIRPRFNPEVNGHWMCDIGRRHYQSLYRQNRLTKCWKRDQSELKEIAYNQAIEEITAAIQKCLLKYDRKEIGFIGSPRMTNEDAYAFVLMAHELVGTMNLDYLNPPEEAELSDRILLREDRNPNSQGCQDMGLSPHHGGMRIKDMLSAARRGTMRVLFVADNDLFLRHTQDEATRLALENIELIVLLQPWRNKMLDYAHYVLPTALWAERRGTFTNFQGRVQKIDRAVEAPEGVKTVREIVADMCRALGKDLNLEDETFVFESIASAIPRYKNLSYENLGAMGQVSETAPEPDRSK